MNKELGPLQNNEAVKALFVMFSLAILTAIGRDATVSTRKCGTEGVAVLTQQDSKNLTKNLPFLFHLKCAERVRLTWQKEE